MAAGTGRGLAQGLRTVGGEMAGQISADVFERGLLVETCGPQGKVVKLLPPLSVTTGEVDQALEILDASVKSALARLAWAGLTDSPDEQLAATVPISNARKNTCPVTTMSWY
ncbi:hypothetical protein [Streptomyces sp. NPDC020965]|uniref:hypothetical protein n=1 Tax=Streptomyces sp. NPDC020965 TaxID=3365105 RepID=UPI0037AE3D0C